MMQSDSKPKNAKRSVHFKTLLTVVPYLWPKDRTGIKLRVIAAMVALALAKVANVWVPLFYRDAVDALDRLSKTLDTSTSTTAAVATGAGIAAIPVALLLGYGLMRLMAVLFQELREALFSRVAQNAIRTVARALKPSMMEDGKGQGWLELYRISAVGRPTSSITSRATASSRLSPGSTNPARTEHRPGGQSF